VGEEVEEREEDGEGLLHTEEAVEGPFAVELDDGLAVGRVAGFALVGYQVLAGVIAFRGTIPEEEAALEGCVVVSVSTCSCDDVMGSAWYSRIDGPPLTQLEVLHCYLMLDMLSTIHVEP
jgi:hypothetical protein